jgi:hypothetical protein
MLKLGICDTNLMAHFSLRLLILLCSAFLLLTLVARALGQAQPPKPALAGFVEGCEGKPLPCWYGIVPGKTTVHDAAAILARAGYKIHYASGQLEARPVSITGCELELPYSDIGDVVLQFSVRQCGPLQLGDFINILGPPTILYSCYYYSLYDRMPTLNLQYAGTYLYRKVSEKERFNRLALPTPYIKIEAISFSGLVLSGGIDWHGFIAYWRYKQLEPSAVNYC